MVDSVPAHNSYRYKYDSARTLAVNRTTPWDVIGGVIVNDTTSDFCTTVASPWFRGASFCQSTAQLSRSATTAAAAPPQPPLGPRRAPSPPDEVLPSYESRVSRPLTIDVSSFTQRIRPEVAHFPPEVSHFRPEVSHFPPEVAHFPPEVSHFPSEVSHFPPSIAGSPHQYSSISL